MQHSSGSIFVVAFLTFVCLVEAMSPYKRVCYYYEPDTLPVSAVNFTVCTHVIYYGVQCDPNDNFRFYWAKQSDADAIADLKTKRTQYGFKLMAVKGGDLSPMCASSATLNTFATNAAKFLKDNAIDGMDTDWEFPNLEFRICYAQLMQALRTAFNPDGLLLSAAVTGDALLSWLSYDVPSLSQSVDFVSIMGYDYRSYEGGYTLTAHHSPLYATQSDFLYLLTQNLDYSASYFASQGMTKSKIVLGLPAYAHGWQLSFTWWNCPLAPTSGVPGPATLDYKDICAFVKSSGTTRVWDGYAKSPYAFNGYRWYSFDDAQSVTIKANYVKQNGYGGVMVWSLHADADFGHVCGTGTNFPIHSLLTDLLG